MTQARIGQAGTIYVVTPVHNRRALTERFVRCLADQTDPDFHLVLVDDGSTDGTADAVRSIVPDTTVITGNGHLWWAGSLEKARRWLMREPASQDELVLIANDDTTFAPDFLANARAVMAGEEHSLLLAQPFSAQSGQPGAIGVQIEWKKLAFKPSDDPLRIDCFPTRGLFLRRADFIDLGPFHTMLLPHYLSDYEFTLRAARRGFRLMSDPRVRLVMDETATGIRTRNYSSALNYLRSVLSIKATMNPIYWTTFVFLASPRRHILRNLVRVWRRFGVGLLQAIRAQPEPPP